MTTLQARPDTWREHRFHAMGCEMAIWLDTAANHLADADTAVAFAEVEALFATYEQALSRFRPDSDLSQLNANAGVWTPVSAPLWDVVHAALEMAVATDGLYDPTLLTAVTAAGYADSFEHLPVLSFVREEVSAVATGRWWDIELDAARRALRLPNGVGLDLGGVAKGYTAQMALERLQTWGPGLVDAGGDLVVGAAPAGYPGWPVAIGAPLLPWTDAAQTPEDLLTLWLAETAVATSGTDYRRWQQNGRERHHLIDPQTGQPADTDVVTATVIADSGYQAEGWATAVSIAGVAHGLELLAAEALPGLVVAASGKVQITQDLQNYLMEM